MNKRVTKDQEDKVVKMFRFNRNNSVPEIARRTGLTENQVGRIIDRFLNKKK